MYIRRHIEQALRAAIHEKGANKTWVTPNMNFYYFRDKDGHEIDLLITGSYQMQYTSFVKPICVICSQITL